MKYAQVEERILGGTTARRGDVVIDELGNFIDGKRSISDIRDAVSAEFAPIALPVVADYFERLAKAGAVAIK